MKKLLPITLLLALTAGVLLSCSSKDDGAESSGSANVPATVTVPAFANGADISWASEMEKDGKKFRRRDGTLADIFDVLKDTGVDAIRLRVWVSPTGGWSGKDDVVALASRATKAGLPVMIDFHYSDFFADPARQTVPSAWKADTGDLTKMCAHVTEHTEDVLSALKSAGVSPAWVQVGNETRGGMIWPTGELGSWSDTAWRNFAALYKAGYEAVKKVFPEALVMPHLNDAFKDNSSWFQKLKSCGAKFDMIGLSHYPDYISDMDWQTANQTVANRITALSGSFGVPVMLVEFGVKASDPARGKNILSDLLSRLSTRSCSGVFYWEPEVYGWWKPAVYTTLGWNAYEQGAFTSDGRPSAILEPFMD